MAYICAQNFKSRDLTIFWSKPLSIWKEKNACLCFNSGCLICYCNVRLKSKIHPELYILIKQKMNVNRPATQLKWKIWIWPTKNRDLGGGGGKSGSWSNRLQKEITHPKRRLFVISFFLSATRNVLNCQTSSYVFFSCLCVLFLFSCLFPQTSQ